MTALFIRICSLHSVQVTSKQLTAILPKSDNTDDLRKQGLMLSTASLMDKLKHLGAFHIDYLLMDPDATLLHCAKHHTRF